MARAKINSYFGSSSSGPFWQTRGHGGFLTDILEMGKTYYSVKEEESQKKEPIHISLALEDIISLELKDAVPALETA